MKNHCAAIKDITGPDNKLTKQMQRIGLVKKKLTTITSVSYTHLRAHETRHDLVCRLLLEKKKKKTAKKKKRLKTIEEV